MILHDTVVTGHVSLPLVACPGGERVLSHHSQSGEIDQANRQISIPEPLH